MTQELHVTPRPDQMSDKAACDFKAESCFTILCHPALRHAWLRCAVLCYGMLCYAVLWHAVLCYAVPGINLRSNQQSLVSVHLDNRL